MSRRRRAVPAPGKPLFSRWESDPGRTYYYASWLKDRPPWYCSRCGSRYVVCVDGDMARFYICVVCHSGYQQLTK